MDVLSEVLKTFQMEADSGSRAVFTAPWGIRIPEERGRALFYYILEGRCVLELDGSGNPLTLSEGDLVLLPGGAAHTLRDDAGGAQSQLLSGRFRFENQFMNQVLDLLGNTFYVITKEQESFSGPGNLFRLLCHETTHPGPGSELVTAEVLKLLFIHFLRTKLAGRTEAEAGNTFALLFDQQLKAALEAIHRRPDRPWTVEELARESNMSRTAFAVRFAQVSGKPPLAYLRYWRMLKAADLLKSTDLTLDRVATNVGYASESAFSAAFRKEMGSAPGAYRSGTTR